MTGTPEPPQRRTWPIAVLVALGVLVLAGLVALFVMLSRPGPNEPGDTPRPTITGLPESARPSITPTPTGVPAPPDQDESRPSPEQLERFRDALESGNTAALEQDFGSTVQVILASSECCGTISAAEALDAMSYVGPGSGATWNFTPDEATLASLRAGDYPDFFPDTAIVGLSSDGYLLSFVPGPDGLIARMLISPVP